MKKLILTLCILAGITACKKEKTDENVAADTVVSEEVEQKSGDWIPLFDGSSFDHWKGYLTDSMPSEWRLEDGAMAFVPGKQGGKNIITREKFTNFILSLEWKIAEGGNSGIFWSVHEDQKFGEAYQTGPEIQVLDNAKHPDAKVAGGTHMAGSLYDMIACPDEFVNPAGEWNLCVIEIDHDKNLGKVSMNGKQVMSFPVHGEQWDNMVANSKFKDWEGFGKYQTGHIGLQDHGDKVWYRNIKIKNI